MLIRPEMPEDRAAIRAVHESAFDTPSEANLVEALREQARPVVSLVAEVDGAVVGHIMFSPVSLAGHPALKLMGLAPLAVAPGHQRKGMGSALVRAGLEACRRLGFGAVIVLGHPQYYPRFGFEKASRFGIHSEYDVPDNVFMAMEVRAGYLNGASGVVRFNEAFANR